MMKTWVVAGAVLPVAVAMHALAGLGTFFMTCRISDVAQVVPAPASAQGRVCDAQDHWSNLVPWVVLGLGVVLAVVLAVRLRSSRWSWVGLTACLWVPVVVFGVLAAPSDACSPEQRAAAPAYDCSRTGNG